MTWFSRSPFAYPNHTYAPWSIEYTCTNISSIPNEQKLQRIFVLSKYTEYYYQWPAPPAHSWKRIRKDLGVDVVASSYDQNKEHHHELPAGIDLLRKLKPPDFAREVGLSRVMLSTGLPTLSPSPYDAL